MHPVGKDVKNVSVSTTLQYFECPSECDISHDIERQTTCPVADINNRAPPILITTRFIWVKTTSHDFTEGPHVLENMVLHSFDHRPRKRL